MRLDSIRCDQAIDPFGLLRRAGCLAAALPGPLFRALLARFLVLAALLAPIAAALLAHLAVAPWSPLVAADSPPGEPAAPAPNQLTPEELSAGWILLFDGQTLFGWSAGSQADWQVVDGVLRVTSGEPGLLSTTSDFADFELRLEFRAPSDTNSGVFLRTLPSPQDPAGDCYELNIAAPAVSPFFTGSLVGRQKAQLAPGSEPWAQADDWHQFHVRAVGPHFQVTLDGQPVLDYTDPRPLRRGKIGLQLNRGQVEFRGVKLRPLGLAPLFNGHDLSGWKVYPGKASQFTVSPEGWLNVQNGDGQLESEPTFGDFALQFEALTRGRHLNSGVFFRCIPGEFWQGYECQIQNGYADNDRARPLDCGTGGFYRRQNARRVVADDFEWFHETLIVSGPHMAAWVNGIQVSDWTDPRTPDPNPRRGRRTEPGTLAIQGHDHSTDLAFRHLRIVELAPRE